MTIKDLYLYFKSEADARNKYAKMGKKTMEDMLTPRGIIFGCRCALFSADNCSS